MMSFKSELLQNRYAAFEKFRTLSPFYDEELASHIFLNFDEVMLTLKEPSLSSDRKRQQFQSVSQCPFSAPLIDFYGQWLMYMDGEAHLEARKLIAVALSKASKNVEEIVDRCFQHCLKKVLPQSGKSQDLAANFAVPLVTSVLAAVFGISSERYSQIIEISKPVVMFLGNGDVGDKEQRKRVIVSLQETHAVLLSCIDECTDPESVIGHLLQKNVAITDITPLLINIVIDGYDPLLAAVNVYLLKLSQGLLPSDSLKSGQVFDEVVRLETPFQYCARIATEDIRLGNYAIRKGERIMSFISAANRDPEYFPLPDEILLREQKFKNISFGAGKHVCPGGNMTKKIAIRLFDLLSLAQNRVTIVYLGEKWTDTFGFRFLKHLAVEVQTTENKVL
ncbi:cytochrome P450 [Kalamiella sp. sgz302252]|uniref:cytochrome P450 n=1 Tax=Pantoea sp. sgz302252 TaxID=3341827 RepID=UPI0036D381D3